MTRPKRYDAGILEHGNIGSDVVETLPTLTCAHCNRVVVLHPLRERERSWCSKCDAYICDSAGCNAECFPTAQALDQCDKPGGPFLLRSPQGYALTTILGPSGEPLTVQRRHVGAGVKGA
jgi:hypothetical protein